MNRREAKGLLSNFKDRMQDIKRFYIHSGAFITFNALFTLINAIEGPNGPLFMLPLMAWTPFLVMHYNRVFGSKGKVSKAWEERMIYELMNGEEMPEEQTLILQEAIKQRLALGADESAEKLQKRIQNLEAIITSQQWETLEKEREMVTLKAKQVEDVAKLVE